MKRLLPVILGVLSAVVASASVNYRTDTTNLVSVTYSSASVVVSIASNIKDYVSVVEDGAHVTITQDSLVSESTCGEIIYQLLGNTSDGSFVLAGSYKSTVELFGLTLSNPSGPAIDIQNGKRIEISAKKETVSTLRDGTSTDTAAWKGCLQCKGHIEFKGKGTLNVYGNYAHAIWAKEYIEMKNCTINVLSAKKDAVNCNQYFQIDSGVLNLSGFADDGIQVSKKTDDTSAENTGNFILNGGAISINMQGSAGESVKTEGTVTKNSGSLTVTNQTTALSDVLFSDPDYTHIYTSTGSCLGKYSAEKLLSLPKGMYILTGTNNSKKIYIQ